MAADYPKNFILLAILAVLAAYTDGDSGLSAREIGEIIERDYGIRADRKTVSDNLRHLHDYGARFGYEIDCHEVSSRKGRDGEMEAIRSGWYLTRSFDESELRLLIDGLLFSRNIGHRQRVDLIKRLAKLAGPGFKTHVENVLSPSEREYTGNELFHTISVLDQAIADGRQVMFQYARFGTDKRQHLRPDVHGQPKQYTVTPFRMVITNNRYYLICNSARHDGLGHYRVDRIRNIQRLETSGRPLTDIRGAERGFNLPRHMAEHIYMWIGESVWARFRMDAGRMDDLVDWFGTDFEIEAEEGERVVVRVKVNEDAMLYWALQYGQHVEILSPDSLRERMRGVIREMGERYGV